MGTVDTGAATPLRLPRILASLGAGWMVVAGCNSAPRPLPATVPAPFAGAVEQGSPPCPAVGIGSCDAYLQAAASCLRQAPSERRAGLQDAFQRRCKSWREEMPHHKKRLDCARALENLLDEPACQLAATTALSSLSTPPVPWCTATSQASPERDPSGPVEIIVRSELTSLAPVRAVAIAIDGVGVVAQYLPPEGATDAPVATTLATFRGRLNPGEHLVRLYVRERYLGVRPGAPHPWSDPDFPLILKPFEKCITIPDGAPLTATFVLIDKNPHIARDQGSVHVRVDLR